MSACEDSKGVTFPLDSISIEDLLATHRRGRKELQGKIQEIKKNAPTSDKKKRKEAMEKIAQMENELDERYANELRMVEARESITAAQAKESSEVNNVAPVVEEGHKQSDEPNYRLSKARRRRDKKAREEKQRDINIREAAGDKANAPKVIELTKIREKLNERDLMLKYMATDGDCMYNAVRHQLVQHGVGAFNVQALRRATADYIRANKDSCIWYMADSTHDGGMLTDEEFNTYCDEIVNLHAWGGQLELQALSAIHNLPIEVLQAEGPPIVQGADRPGPKLTIVYHRHMYSLGEHYNSTLSVKKDNGDTGND